MRNKDRARIVAKNHIVCAYSLNGGRKQFVAVRGDSPPSKADKKVFRAIKKVGFDWADVTNYLDGKGLDKAINRHTIL